MSEFLSPHEQEAKIHAFKIETNKRLCELLFQRGVSMQEIARILGAEEFIRIEKVGENKPPVVRFDVQGFVDKEVEKGTFLTLPESFTQEENVIIPPDSGETIQSGTGENEYEKPGIIPRSRYLAEVLTDLHQPYRVVSGKNLKNMVRSLSYQIFIIPGLRKMVFVNDEQGNMTFIVHDVDEGEYREFAGKSKDRLRDLEGTQVTSLRNASDSEEWKQKMLSVLEMKDAGNAPVGKVPEGWFTNKELAAMLKVNRDTTERIIERLEKEHPEWVQTFHSRTKKRFSRFCSPEMVVQVTAEIEKRADAPEGWVYMLKLVSDSGLSLPVINRMVEKERKGHPDWFHLYLTENKKYIEHFHPDLVAIVHEAASDYLEKVPLGWEHATALAKRFDSDRSTILRLAENEREKHPEWFKTYVILGGESEHYHPDLVTLITDTLGKRVEAPAGWYTYTAAAEEVGIDPITLRKFLKKKQITKETHPEMVGDYLTKNRVMTEMVSPELFELAKKEFTSRETAPEGWMTNASISKKIGEMKAAEKKMAASRQLIKEIAESHRVEHPGWFMEYKAATFPYAYNEHYHPDLVAIILKKLER